MSAWNTREDLVSQAVTLARSGMSARAISRTLRVSRNTVRKILMAHSEARTAPHQALPAPSPRAPRESPLSPFLDQVRELLERYPDITAQRIFEELRQRGFVGGYTAVKTQVRRLRPAKKPEPSLPTPIRIPGETAESDWSPYKIEFTTGLVATVQAFGYVLRYSTRKSYRLFERADFYALLDGHVQTFERFGGAAHKCKYDGQKAVIIAWEGDQPIYNPRFLAFSTHYDFRPEACRRNSPNDKPRVERSFWEFEKSFLPGRSFRDLGDMRGQLAEWERTICDPRPHKKLKRPRLELFAEELPLLRPLPRHPYDTARVIYRLCGIDGFISWGGNRYAVPFDHITDIVPVRITERELFVYAPDLRCVARHELAPRSAGLDVDPGDIHPRYQLGRGASLEQLEHAFATIGEGPAAFFRAMAAQSPRLCGHHARHILLLRERYTTDDLVRALQHALTFGAFDHNAIARILDARAKPRRLAEYYFTEVTERHLRGFDAPSTPPRDLDEYDRLPITSANQNPEEPCPEPENPSPSPGPHLRMIRGTGSDDTSSSSD